MTGREQTGGGLVIGGGGGPKLFWEGVLWYVFPSPELSTSLCFLSAIPFLQTWIFCEESDNNSIKPLKVLSSCNFMCNFGSGNFPQRSSDRSFRTPPKSRTSTLCRVHVRTDTWFFLDFEGPAPKLTLGAVLPLLTIEIRWQRSQQPPLSHNSKKICPH